MALTTTQVNQAFLATLGRPAEGSAATWGSTLSLDALLDSIFIAENTDGDFVEYLYQNILGRASDAEGKAFWNSLLATTPKEEVLAQFKAAVIAAGKADPSNADYQSLIAQNKAFVTTLYTNLLGRSDAASADAEGVEFWANALASGTSKGELLAQFTAAAMANPNSDDAQTLSAKINVANEITAKFNDFNADVTADEKKAALDALKTTMTEVVAGSTAEDFQEKIDTFAGNYQNRVAQVFTTKNDDQLDASESTAATTFSGTINISDSEKSTIESGDTATGNPDFAAANTLIVDVKSDGKEKDFNFNTETAGVTVSNVNNLTINNDTADVTLNLTGGDNYTGKVAIAGKGDRADVTVDQNVESLSVSTSGAKKANTDVTVNNGSTLGTFEGSAAVDTLTIKGNIAKSINTGDGADNVTLEATAKVYEKATINLGAGDDTLTISTSDIGNYNANGTEITAENLKASVTIDGGAGTKDKLVLSSDISKGVKAITGVEFIDSTTGAISAVAADGLKTTVSGTLTINADYKEAKSINLKDIKSFTNDTGSLSLSGITYENITLSSNIKENIVVDAHTAESKKSYAEISKFAAGDKISVKDLNASAVTANDKNLDLTNYNDVANLLSDKTDAVAINDAAGKKAYIWQMLDETDARLVAIVDKKLKESDNGFILDGSTTQTEEQGTTSTIKYVSGSTTLDINEGNYGTGTKTQFFNIPANEKDVLKVVLDGNYSQIGSLRVDNSGNNKGTVEVHVLDGANGNIDVTAVKDKIYLGEGRNNLDASNYTFIGTDDLVANTTGKLTVAFGSLGTGGNRKAKLDLTNVNANVTISGDVTQNTDLKTLFVSASGNDTITLDTSITNAQSITLTDAAENVTVSTPITAANASLATMLNGAAANDTISAKIGTNAAQALALTLSDAKDTVDVSAAKGTGGALTITTTNFDKANDKIDFGADATKGELVKTQITEQDTIKFITVTNGVLTLSGDADIANDKLTITNALAALSKDQAKNALLNKVLFFTDKDGVNYLITEGATTNATDDVAIALTGVNTAGFEIANGFVTLA